MELKTGKVSGDFLAKWFGVSRTYFSRSENKSKYLAILSRYALYHIEAKGNGATVIIDEVYEAKYIGEAGPRPRQRVKELVQQNWNPSGLDSCSRVAKENYPILQAEGYTIAETTNYRYTCESRTELWGSPIKRTQGERGRCWYEWCKKDSSGKPVPFTEQEQQIKKELVKRYFGSLDDWTLGIVDDLSKGKITPEEAGLALADISQHGNFVAWKAAMEEVIGEPIYKGTRIENIVVFE